jgi:hypothetical protein
LIVTLLATGREALKSIGARVAELTRTELPTEATAPHSGSKSRVNLSPFRRSVVDWELLLVMHKLAPELASTEKSCGAIENSGLIVVADAPSSIRAIFSCVQPAFARHAVMKRTTVAMSLTGFIIPLLLLFSLPPTVVY